MPEFLSPAWLADLDRRVRSADAVRAEDPIVVEQVVTGVPDRGEVRYRMVVDESGGRLDQTAEPVTVRLTTDYQTAAAIERGEENAQTALAAGRMRLGGSVDDLVRVAAALTRVR